MWFHRAAEQLDAEVKAAVAAFPPHEGKCTPVWSCLTKHHYHYQQQQQHYSNTNKNYITALEPHGAEAPRASLWWPDLTCVALLLLCCYGVVAMLLLLLLLLCWCCLCLPAQEEEQKWRAHPAFSRSLADAQATALPGYSKL